MNQRPADTVALFDFVSREGKPSRLTFTDPVETLAADSVDEVRDCLRAVQRASDEGLYAAGYVAYEAAPAFDRSLVVRGRAMRPLLWFGIFDRPAEITSPLSRGDYQLSQWEPSVGRGVYDRNVGAVREAIARGDTYQANYTLRMRARFEGDALAFYQHLQAAQRAPYGAYLNAGRYQILSASPELFFRREGTRIVTRPMKGTVGRGRWCEEDDALGAWLANSEKNRAENVMIVDLLRNDLGRIADVGSVRVENLCEVERYPTVFQMCSAVGARLRRETTLEEIFAALFPCGSVTGAPKVSTMRLIAALEDSPRNVYCGAVGMLAPRGEA
ncbi:MAG TPA: chorismate-binding protein, partial [Pyrinomonadaceae bacterium]|nr:chorismate-binding protein [Pyrinomonadaceae bacterium]